MESYRKLGLRGAHLARRQTTAQTQEYVKLEQVTLGIPQYPWGSYDSHLLPSHEAFIPTSYQECFVQALPENQQWLQSYIQDLKAAKVARTGDPHVSFQGLDLFGQGTNLFGEFAPGTFTQTVANSLTDQRQPEHILRDRSINNTFVPGNYFDPATRQHITEALHHKKVDVIFLKAIAGRYSLPPNPFLLARELQTVWSMLEDEGVMFVQIPNEVHNLVQPWLNKITETGTIEGQLGENMASGYFLRLNRHAGAPEQLPFLSRREVTDTLMQAVAA